MKERERKRDRDREREREREKRYSEMWQERGANRDRIDEKGAGEQEREAVIKDIGIESHVIKNITYAKYIVYLLLSKFQKCFVVSFHNVAQSTPN